MGDVIGTYSPSSPIGTRLELVLVAPVSSIGDYSVATYQGPGIIRDV
jgi:hypothetical protein